MSKLIELTIKFKKGIFACIQFPALPLTGFPTERVSIQSYKFLALPLQFLLKSKVYKSVKKEKLFACVQLDFSGFPNRKGLNSILQIPFIAITKSVKKE